MVKILKILGNIVLSLVELLLLCLIALAYFIRTPDFQTYLAKEGASYLSEYLDAEVSINKVTITFFDRVYIDGVYLSDQQSDTLGYIGELYVNVNLLSLRSDKIELDKVTLDRSTFNLKKNKGEEHTNLQFLIDAFSTSKEKQPTDFELIIHELNISEINFFYEDFNKEINPTGVDFAHLGLRDINLTANNIIIHKKDYSAEITSLNFRDRSGFILNELVANAYFSDKRLDLDALEIITPHSDIVVYNLNMQTNDLSSYKSFVDEVALNIELTPSTVSFVDIAYFAPTLHGMNQVIEVEGKTSSTIADFMIQDLDLKTGKNTHIAGDFRLPDFKNLDEAMIYQNIKTLHLSISDLEEIMLSFGQDSKAISIPDQLKRMEFIKGENLLISGNINQLELTLGTIHSKAGELTFQTPITISALTNDKPLKIRSSTGKRKYISFKKFDLGSVLAVKEIGEISGSIGFEAIYQEGSYFKMSKVNGLFNRFYALGYDYKNVNLSRMTLDVNLKKKKPESTINGLFFIRDDNLDLVYEGKTTFGDEIALDVFIDLQCANLSSIHELLNDRGELVAKLNLNGSGNSFETFSGSISVDSIYYEEDGEWFTVNHFEAELIRSKGNDLLTIHSDIVNARMEGFVHFDLVLDNILYQSSQIFPAFFPDLEYISDPESHFTYTFEIFELNPILEIFLPELKVSNNTTFEGSYNGLENSFDLNIDAEYIEYDDLYFKNVSVFQELHSGELLALYTSDGMNVKDSVILKDIHFTSIAANSFMDSHLIFHDKNNSRSNLEWHTLIFEVDGFDIDILPSYFTVNDHRWDLKQKAHVNFSQDCFLINDFKLERDNQFVNVSGQISKLPQDKLFVDINNLDLSDVGAVLVPDNDVLGRANISGYISEPFTELKFLGKSHITGLFIDTREVGDVKFETIYNAQKQSIQVEGDLFFKAQNTFSFNGDYWLSKETDNLDLKMEFNNTNISVVNAFLDPNVVSGIRGQLKGVLDLTGTLKEPVLDGEIYLKGGKVNLTLLGADFNYEGKIISNEHGVFINTMPITDEEGNTGFVVGQMSHDKFSDVAFELVFDFENHPTIRDPLDRSRPMKLDRFLVMKTKYEEESVYYGNAYMTGSATVFGSANDITINVNAKTRRGTWINFPMYGPKTIEQDGFIKFKSPDDEEDEEPKINLSGVNLSLNFDVTPDARVKLIFDDNLGDEITAYGYGNLLLGIDNYGDLALNGTYNVTNGVYNFAMGPYKQNFFISPGGTVQWTGNPYYANLDIETYYKTTTNLSVVMVDVLETNVVDNNTEVYSYLKLRGDMNKPEISFDLDAPKATDAGKAVISRIRSDKDELNRQFFSMLIWKRFQPLVGQEGRAATANSNAALDLVSTQINSVLSKVSEDYKMNVALESDDMTGESSMEFGVKKGFMDDRLVVAGSFGVGNYQQASAHQNSLIGDINIEYLLNDKGTFRINVFNESNTNSVVQNTDRGLFTQGVGVSYKEDFHNLRDFKFFQFIADLFRENKKLKYRDKSNYKAIPDKYKQENAIKKEEE